MGHVYCKHIRDKSLRGYTVRGVPFLRLYDAETQCARIGVEPNESSLLYAPEQARRFAVTSEKEALYLRSRLEEAQKRARGELSRLAAERDSAQAAPPDMMRGITLELLEERIQRQIGYCDGLSEAWRLLHQRACELWELTRLKEDHP